MYQDYKDLLSAFHARGVRYLSRDDLIAAKLAAARPQDLADVEAIRRAAESQCPQPAKEKPAQPKSGGPSQ
jgi:hypothetical protein